MFDGVEHNIYHPKPIVVTVHLDNKLSVRYFGYKTNRKQQIGILQYMFKNKNEFENINTKIEMQIIELDKERIEVQKRRNELMGPDPDSQKQTSVGRLSIRSFFSKK